MMMTSKHTRPSYFMVYVKMNATHVITCPCSMKVITVHTLKPPVVQLSLNCLDVHVGIVKSIKTDRHIWSIGLRKHVSFRSQQYNEVLAIN